MPLTTKDQAQIKADILRDIENLLDEAITNDDSDYAIRASATSAAIEGILQHLHWIVKQIFPDTADVDIMELHAALHQVIRKSAVRATGEIVFSGASGTAIPAGTQAEDQNNNVFTTISGSVVSASGTVTISAQAVTPGVAGNVGSQVDLTVVNAPTGITSQAVGNNFTGGVEVESDASLLSRLLFKLRNPPSSGNAADYKRWALEVPGVFSAKVYPLRAGLGTVDVVITGDNVAPNAALITAAEAYINEQRPVGLNVVNVVGPATINQDWEIALALEGITLAEATLLVSEVLDSYYATLAPGETVVKSVVEGLISGISGVTDRVITLPEANVVPTVDASTIEWCRMGNLDVGLLS